MDVSHRGQVDLRSVFLGGVSAGTKISIHSKLATMASNKKMTMGVGAQVSCLSKFLHPSEHIRAKYVNPVKGHRLEGLGVVREEQKVIRRRTVKATPRPIPLPQLI